MTVTIARYGNLGKYFDKPLKSNQKSNLVDKIYLDALDNAQKNLDGFDAKEWEKKLTDTGMSLGAASASIKFIREVAGLLNCNV